MLRHLRLGIVGIMAAFMLSVLTPTPSFAADNGIVYPRMNTSVRGTIDVSGVAAHPTFRKWQLDLMIDGDPQQAAFLALGEEPVDTRAQLAAVDTTRYPNGEHTLRLRVVHSNLNYDEHLRPLIINNPQPSRPASAAEISPEKTTPVDSPKGVADTHAAATRLNASFDRSGRWIEIDLAAQTLRAWDGENVFMETLISSGRTQTPTVQGVFQVKSKIPSQRMIGPGYNLPNVKSVMYFFSNYAIHGAYWHDNFGNRMSHGCVNVREDEAQALFDWASIGTPVFVYK